MLRRARPLVLVAAAAGLLWLLFPFGFPSYDSRYALIWGDQIAHGTSPDYGAAEPPTPHPLGLIWGALVSPLGAGGAADATVVLAYVALATVAYLVYRLGSLWFSRPIGAVAAAIVLTRFQFLLFGMRASIDLPFIALVLAALVVETRHPRAGWPVLGLLAAAGLIRPEAWLFSTAYLAYLALERDPATGKLAVRRPGVGGSELARLAAIALSAPIAWAAFDLITTGEPLYSFTATHERVETLERHTGPVDLLRYGPGALGQVMQWPGIVGAAAGLALSVAFLRQRALVGVGAALLAGAAFAVLASAGFSIIARYTMIASAVLAVFCAVALLGWRLLAPDHPWRRRWQLIAIAVAATFVVQAPQQWEFVSDARAELEEQSTLETDLRRLADSGAFAESCRPIFVSSDRAIPRLAAWLDLSPSEIAVAGEPSQPRHGYLLNARSQAAKAHFEAATVPAQFRAVARNESFGLYARC